MQTLYNSDNFVVVEFDLALGQVSKAGPTQSRGGYEIVDKFARKGIFLEGTVAESFKKGVASLVERGPTEEEFDEFIAGYTALAQQPVVVH
jgi:hypothetical protein